MTAVLTPGKHDHLFSWHLLAVMCMDLTFRILFKMKVLIQEVRWGCRPCLSNKLQVVPILLVRGPRFN